MPQKASLEPINVLGAYGSPQNLTPLNSLTLASVTYPGYGPAYMYANIVNSKRPSNGANRFLMVENIYIDTKIDLLWRLV